MAHRKKNKKMENVDGKFVEVDEETLKRCEEQGYQDGSDENDTHTEQEDWRKMWKLIARNLISREKELCPNLLW